MADVAIALLFICGFTVCLMLVAVIYEHILCPLAERLKEVYDYVISVQTRR